MSTADLIESRLRGALAPEILVLEDDSHQHAGHAGAGEGSHFTLRVTSSRFNGLSRVQRQIGRAHV